MGWAEFVGQCVSAAAAEEQEEEEGKGWESRTEGGDGGEAHRCEWEEEEI